MNKKIIGLRFGSVNGFSKNIRNENLLNSLVLSSLEKNQLVVSNGGSLRSVLGLNDLCRAIKHIIETGEIKNNVYNITSINDTIMNFALKIKDLTGSSLLINDSFKTDYSFDCSSKLFENDYNFKFTDNVEYIFNELVDNYDNIIFNKKRKKIIYE
jgi:nucleoside-diphosphate-sugar epimerase